MMLSARGRRPSFHLPTLAWAALVLVSSSSFAGPRVNVRQGEWYFGEVYEGATVQHTFEIENVGDAPLHVGQIRSLCAPCTATVVSDNPVMPGGTARLLVTYEAKERLGDVTAGVIVHLDDPEEPFKKLTMKGTVLQRGDAPRAEVSPSRIEVGVIAARTLSEYSLRVSNGGKEPLFLNGIAASRHCVADWTGPHEERQLLPGQHVDVKLHLDTQRLRGALGEYVAIQSTDPARPLVTVPVTGYVVDSVHDISPPPSTVMISVPSGQQEPAAGSPAGIPVAVRSGFDGPIRVWVSGDPPPQSVRWQQVAPRGSATLDGPPGEQGQNWTYVLLAIPRNSNAAGGATVDPRGH